MAAFDWSVFDYDVSIIHITQHPNFSAGYYQNIPKLLKDARLALDQGRSVICLPDSKTFRPEAGRQGQTPGDPIYEWVKELGIELRENSGNDIKASGAGRAEAIQAYLVHVPKYN